MPNSISGSIHCHAVLTARRFEVAEAQAAEVAQQEQIAQSERLIQTQYEARVMLENELIAAAAAAAMRKESERQEDIAKLTSCFIPGSDSC